MFSFRSENIQQLSAYNIRINELKKPAMSQPQPRKISHLPKVRMLSRAVRPGSGIRITNVKSIRLPNPESVKQQEDKLRAEVKKEIASRIASCAYPGYKCGLRVLTGRQYCGTHILLDPTAPYVQCAHSYSNGERCPAAAPSLPAQQAHDPPLCFAHARSGMLMRQRAAAPPPPVVSTETLLHQLNHYVTSERPRTTSCASSVSVVSDPSEPEQLSPVAVDPFNQLDATKINAAYSSSILDCASASDSDGESVTLGPGGTCRYTACSSDTEDATVEDSPLWRAGIYSAEEAVRETKNVLITLKEAYLRQMDRLKYLLQTARLQYLKSLQAEKEQYCSINCQARSGGLSVRERRQLRKLKAYASYRHPHAHHSVMKRKLAKKRAKVNEPVCNRPVPPLGRCTWAEEGVRCTNSSVPASKHCSRHILHNRSQVLFKPCNDVRGVDGCREPVPKLPLCSDSCRYHTDPPSYTVFTVKKDGSDSETDSQTSIVQFSDTEDIAVEAPPDALEMEPDA